MSDPRRLLAELNGRAMDPRRVRAVTRAHAGTANKGHQRGDQARAAPRVPG